MTTNSTLFIGVSQLDLFAPYQGLSNSTHSKLKKSKVTWQANQNNP
ncbi:hypothetical protein [Photobacterium swingsii]